MANRGKNQHVIPHNGQWGVRGAGNRKVTKVTSTQTEAIKIAKNIATNSKSEVVIHRPNGRIRDSNSYGHDPHPPKG